jgi:hypothetical protein
MADTGEVVEGEVVRDAGLYCKGIGRRALLVVTSVNI